MATDTLRSDRTQQAGKQALRLIDQLLPTERPQKVGHDFWKPCAACRLIVMRGLGFGAQRRPIVTVTGWRG